LGAGKGLFNVNLAFGSMILLGNIFSLLIDGSKLDPSSLPFLFPVVGDGITSAAISGCLLGSASLSFRNYPFTSSESWWFKLFWVDVSDGKL
jgi:hypothetical protein